MVPPSSKDLDSSVDFLKDLLRNDTHSRSTNLSPAPSNGQPNKYAKVRSFDRNASPEPSSAASRKDAMVYKHDDGDVKTYKSSSRHIDRRNVRFHGEEDSSDLGSLKKQLKDTQDLLDRTYKDEDEDADLDGEIEDLKYRIRRVQEDIEFNKSGRRTEGKDNERRRLERELLFLMHEKMPELEEKVRERDRKKRSDVRAAARLRDDRNNRNKYGRRTASDSEESGSDEEEVDRGYLRGSYSRSSRDPNRPQSPPSRGYQETSRSSSKSEQRRKDTPQSPPPPPAPSDIASTPRSPAPAPPVPAPHPGSSASTGQNSVKRPQTAEERQAYIRAEAQRRVQERMRMLTGQTPSASPEPTENLSSGYDTTLQARLEQDKREAAKKAEDDDKAAAERERLRQIKLEEERQSRLAAEQDRVRESAEALQKVSNEVTASEMKHDQDVGDLAASAARDEIQREEMLNKTREQDLAAQERDSQSRMAQLKSSFQQKAKSPPPPPSPRSHKAPPKPPPSRKQAPAPPTSHRSSALPHSPAATAGSTSAPTVEAVKPADSQNIAGQVSQPPTAPTPPPPPPPALSSTGNAVSPPAAARTGSASSSTNPFHRLGATGQSPAAGAAAAGPKGANNPFFRPPTGAFTSSSSSSNAAPLVQPTPQKPRETRKEDDWGDDHNDKEVDSDDSDEEGGPDVKQMRAGLAGLLFGGASGTPSAPSSRPSSTRPEGNAKVASAKDITPSLPPL